MVSKTDVAHSYSVRRRTKGLSTICTFLLICLAPPVGIAGVTLDGSMGPAGPLSGPNYLIGSDLGQQRGSNLFHSFGQFNLLSNEIATFSGPTTVANVIGRVTGGGPSSIDGLIRCTIPSANLFLINPSGMIFGPNAELDVKGSFHASTADYLKQSGDGIFYADLGKSSVLAVAAPSAFGFLSTSPAAISLQGSKLAVVSGKTLSMVGGNIAMTDGAGLTAPSGVIAIASVASSGEAIPGAPGQPPSLAVDSFTGLGEITMSGGSSMAVASTGGGGTVLIRGGRFMMVSADNKPGVIDANTQSTSNGSPTAVDIDIANDFILYNGVIRADSRGAGSAGDIRIRAGTLEARPTGPYYYGYIESTAYGSGKGGSVSIAADTLKLGDYGEISTTAKSSGKGGSVSISAGTLNVQDGAFIGTSTASTGAGGDVTVTTGPLTVKDGGTIATVSSGPSNAGKLDVTAGDVLLSGTNSVYLTGLGSQAGGTGNAGDVRLSATSLRIVDTASIFSEPYGSGRGGSLDISAGSVEMANWARISTNAYGAGRAGNITLTTETLDISSGAAIRSTGISGKGLADGGDIDVTAGRVTVTGLDTSSDPFGSDLTGIFAAGRTGKGGNIHLAADTLTMTNRGSINSSSYGGGAGGNITVEAGRVELLGGSAIQSVAYTSGPGGNISVTADDVVISGVHPDIYKDSTKHLAMAASTISTQSYMTGGAAGDVNVTAGSLKLLDGGRLTTETFGPGAGGNIVVTADSVLVSGVNADLKEFLTTAGREARLAGAGLFSGSHGPKNGTSGPAGSVRITTKNLEMREGGLISSETDSTGAGGNIGIASDVVSLSSGASISARSSGSGNAGNIDIEAAEAFEIRNGAVTTEATQSDGGNIMVNAGTLLRLVDSQITSSVNGGPGTIGGNITIDPQFVILKNSRIVANAYEGTGGNIFIAANVFLADPKSIVDASSALGISGTVDIRAPISNVSGLITPLSSDIVSATALLRERCIARIREGKYSSFVVVGRDGLPIEPGNLMPSLPY